MWVASHHRVARHEPPLHDKRGGPVGGNAVNVTPSGAALARASALNLLARLTSGAATLGLAILSTHVLDTNGRGIYAILTTWAGIGATVITAMGGAIAPAVVPFIVGVLAASVAYGRAQSARLALA